MSYTRCIDIWNGICPLLDIPHWIQGAPPIREHPDNYNFFVLGVQVLPSMTIDEDHEDLILFPVDVDGAAVHGRPVVIIPPKGQGPVVIMPIQEWQRSWAVKIPWIK